MITRTFDSLKGSLLLVSVWVLSPSLSLGQESQPVSWPLVAQADQSGAATSCFRMIGALFLCLGVFALGVHLYRRYAPTSGPLEKRRLKVREKLRLSPKSTLSLVELDGREFLVASGSEHVSIVSHTTTPVGLFDDTLDACDSKEVFNA